MSNWVNFFKLDNFCNSFQMKFLINLSSLVPQGFVPGRKLFQHQVMGAGFLKFDIGKCLINADARDICDESAHQANPQSWLESDD